MNVYDYHRPRTAVPKVGRAVRVGIAHDGDIQTVLTGVISAVTYDRISIRTENGTAEFDRWSGVLANFPNSVVEERQVRVAA